MVFCNLGYIVNSQILNILVTLYVTNDFEKNAIQ